MESRTSQPSKAGYRSASLARWTRNRINYVRITLEPDDVYTVEFCVIRKLTSRRVSLWEGVYCDNLCDLFREQTGLETRMPTFA